METVPTAGAAETFTVRILANGTATLRADREGETFHPELGPEEEARRLYVDQTGLDTLWAAHTEEPLVVWDVGLGAAANSIEVLRSLQRAGRGRLEMWSFDRTLAPLEAARAAHAADPTQFAYLRGWDWPALISGSGGTLSGEGWSARWTWVLGDFTQWVRTGEGAARPRFILYDCYSPANNWPMWTLDHWKRLRRLLGDGPPVRILFYSRSTALRVTLALAGFYVGIGAATGTKDETTVASTTLESLARPLGPGWLDRVHRSAASRPFVGEKFERKPISPFWWETLRAHPQFAGATAPATL